MTFRQEVTKFVCGNHVATLLRILPEDPWRGLVEFHATGEICWVNAAFMWQAGWRCRS